MARFKKENSKELPEINTGSMSDIIFMFLFFFMVITNMRETNVKVKFTTPKASEIQKLALSNFRNGHTDFEYEFDVRELSEVQEKINQIEMTIAKMPRMKRIDTKMIVNH